MEEELELFKDLEKNEQETPIIINGDVIISFNNQKKENIKNIRNKITKTLKTKIKNRDSKTCLCCGRKFENHLEVHHIMPVSKYPELVCVPENLASLCQQCHDKYHKLYKDNEGAVSFATFLKKYGR